MTPAGLPPWPAAPVAHGPVVLRQFIARDVPMAQELSTDPYVPLVGSRRGHRPVAGGPGLRAGDSRLLGHPERPGARRRVGGADRPDLVRLDHPGAAPDRALHRALILKA